MEEAPKNEEVLSPALQKEKEKTEIPVSGKRMLPRIIAFVVVFGVAVTFLTLGFLGVFSPSKSGLTEIEISAERGLNAGEGLSFRYYLDKKTASQKTITALYSEAGKKAYKLTDERTRYDDAPGIGRLNATPNAPLPIDGALYDLLKEVDDSSSVSLYLAPVIDFYDRLARMDAQTRAAEDPEANAASAAYVDSYMELVNNGDISLYFGANHEVTLSLSQSYLSWVDENEYEGPYISLGWLRGAARIALIRNTFLDEGLENGYFQSDDGIFYSLGGLAGIRIGYYDVSGALYAAIPIQDEATVATYANYPRGSGDPTAYRHGSDYHSSNVRLDSGRSGTALLSSLTHQSGGEVMKTAMASLSLLAANPDDLNSRLPTIHYAYQTVEGPFAVSSDFPIILANAEGANS